MDYYYLRMRAGIADFERSRYLPSLVHFNKAGQFNDLDPNYRIYNYYALLNSGNEVEAALYYKLNEPWLDSAVNHTLKRTASLRADAGFHENLSGNPSLKIDPSSLEGRNGSYSITGDFHFGSLLLEHNPGYRIKFTHGFTYLSKQNYYYGIEEGNELETEDLRVRQYQYYASLSVAPALTWKIKASMHYARTTLDEVTLTPRGMGNSYRLPSSLISSWLTRLSLHKRMGNFKLMAGGAWSNFSQTNQWQTDITGTWFPLGNLNLYTWHSVYRIQDDGAGRNAFSHFAGARILDQLWIEAGLDHGEMHNMSTSEGYILFNGPETLTLAGEFRLIIPLQKTHIELRSRYTEGYYRFMDSFSEPVDIHNISFQGITISGGITWRF